MLKTLCYFFPVFLCCLVGCGKNDDIDLNAEKNHFLNRIFEGELDDGPFFLNYSIRTVFFSKEVICFFGEFTRYTSFPHDSKYYEGKTFCRINGKFRPITFDDLFSTAEQKEFVRKYCEDMLKASSLGYFGEDSPLCDKLNLKDIQTFLVHEHFLVIVFQRYVVAGLYDYPTILKIPYNTLKGHFNPHNILTPLLEKTVASKSFISSWEDVCGQEFG